MDCPPLSWIKSSLSAMKRVYFKGENLTIEGEYGDEMYVITEGYVEVMLSAKSDLPARVVVNLGAGQITGEMALIDQGPLSATVRAITSPTVVQVINRVDFDNLCQVNTQIGYTVMRNMAGDLVFSCATGILRKGDLNL